MPRTNSMPTDASAKIAVVTSAVAEGEASNRVLIIFKPDELALRADQASVGETETNSVGQGPTNDRDHHGQQGEH